jgi:hypothetical protein
MQLAAGHMGSDAAAGCSVGAAESAFKAAVSQHGAQHLGGGMAMSCCVEPCSGLMQAACSTAVQSLDVGHRFQCQRIPDMCASDAVGGTAAGSGVQLAANWCSAKAASGQAVQRLRPSQHAHTNRCDC